jgi:hypothetical protein
LRGTIPAPDLPPGPRSALIIATAAYADDGLRQLRSPAQDAAALAGVLGDPAIGGFAITSLIDQDEPTITRTAARFLHGRGTGELVLIYLSCHGLLDARGRLFFAATDTDKDLLSATAIESTWLTDRLEECRARQQILILDCCFSGAFARGGKGTVDLEQKLAGPGRGRVVLTASRQGEYSFEGKELAGSQVEASMFTAGLVDGLATGAADTDQDGLVSVEDAFVYAARHVLERGGAQTPQRWVYAAEGSIVLARSPTGKVITTTSSPPPRSGALIATASNDGTARIWNADSGSRRTTIIVRNVPFRRSFVSDVYGVALSPNGAIVATASMSRIARTWDTATGIPRNTLKGHKDRIYGVAFSPDGTLVATASGDGTARTWDSSTGTLRATLTGHTAALRGVAFSPDGTLIATASDDMTARTWDSSTGTLRATLTGHTATLRGVAFSPDGTLIATASADNTARIWDTATGTHRATLTGHKGPVYSVAFSPHGTLIATASADNTARIWNTTTSELRTIFAGHDDWVQGVAFSPDGTLIATASFDKTARIWDAATGALRAILAGHKDAVLSVAFSPGKA